MNLPNVLHEVDGEIRVKGHRISLYHIISAYEHRWIGPESMVFYFETLSYAEIKEVFKFYEENREEVGKYMKAYRKCLAQQLAMGKQLNREELCNRYEAMNARKAKTAIPITPTATAMDQTQLSSS